jgi:SBF-like CPA transporter family (DUF4137)
MGPRVSVQVQGVHVVTFINICVVFFISGLTLRTDELKDALTNRTIPGTTFAFLSIIGLTPVLGFALRDLPLHPEGFVIGLTIFCIVPTTLGVGVSLVTSAKVRSARESPLLLSSSCSAVSFMFPVCLAGQPDHVVSALSRRSVTAKSVAALGCKGCVALPDSCSTHDDATMLTAPHIPASIFVQQHRVAIELLSCREMPR